MTPFVRALTIGSLLLGTTACIQTGFGFREAGAHLSDAGFGETTARNILVQTADPKYAQELNARFMSEVPATLNFAFRSSVLDASAKEAVRQQAGFILKFPEVMFTVYGHTDLVGSEAANKRLGLRRAHAVVRELESHGISRARLQAVVSFGETLPLIASQDRERANRRTVTEVTGFLMGSQMVVDGRYAEIVHREYIQSGTAASSLTAESSGRGNQGGGNLGGGTGGAQ